MEGCMVGWLGVMREKGMEGDWRVRESVAASHNHLNSLSTGDTKNRNEHSLDLECKV
jgi:hypothetical protein